jgi:hypothetical protein
MARIELPRINAGAVSESVLVLQPRKGSSRRVRGSRVTTTHGYALFFEDDPAGGLRFQSRDEVLELVGLIEAELSVDIRWTKSSKAPAADEEPAPTISVGPAPTSLPAEVPNMESRPKPGKGKHAFEVWTPARPGWLAEGRDKGHKRGVTMYIYAPGGMLIRRLSTPHGWLRAQAKQLAFEQLVSLSDGSSD